MSKNFTLAFLMGLFGLITTSIYAQHDATIEHAKILYWVGEGQNEVAFIVNWNEPDTALAWGYRFNGENVTVKEMMDAIATADSRFSYEGESFVSDITFNDGVLNLKLSPSGYFMYNVNGVMAMEYFNTQTIENGDYVKWGDTNCGILVDPENWAYVWPKPIIPVYPYAVESTIASSEILYWIGEGNNNVIFCVNWNNPNKSLAWGYRFEKDTVTVKDVMDGIMNVDMRFSYVTGDWGVSDIKFKNDEFDLALTGDYWMYNVNGLSAMWGYELQTVVNGDFIKWGDESCGTEIAEWTYVWTQPVEAVSVYTNITEYDNSILRLYPNPATSEAFVTLPNAGPNTISVYDVQGRLVGKQTCMAAADGQVRIDTGSLVSGVYFVTVCCENAQYNVKLIIQ